MCGYHHHHVDTQGWAMHRTGGRVWLTPPTWIDPEQQPRTNEYWKPLRT
jgi:hypothetical protein